VAARPHPFPRKLTLNQAGEVRRLRNDGASLTELADRFRIAKSSVSAIVHFHAHVPDGVVRVALPEFERALIEELASEAEVQIEQFAADLLESSVRHVRGRWQDGGGPWFSLVYRVLHFGSWLLSRD
jgi:hypothetical protein